jgi:hypothetical protein
MPTVGYLLQLAFGSFGAYYIIYGFDARFSGDSLYIAPIPLMVSTSCSMRLGPD